MIQYKKNNQLIEEFNTPLETKLDSNNRWVKLSKEIPWDRMASVYNRKLSQNIGAATFDARIVRGAFLP